ncbi:MAG: DegV family protein [Erysipelotrichaceae bacterium]|nr:DegV family protein [Erysipelotrichaceae bacterium]
MIKLTADSTCDLNKEFIIKHNIDIMPIHIVVEDKVYNDNVDILPKDIFDLTEKQGKLCKTAAVNVYEYENFFKQFTNDYDAIIHVSLGSAFSSSCQNAHIAANEFSNVYVIDSANLSSGSGLLTYEIALMIRENKDVETILDSAKRLIKKISGSFVIDQLDYLYKGGRCSNLELAATRVLRIKPSIEVIDGNMQVGRKYRGSFELSLRNYINDRLSEINDIDDKILFLTHTNCDELTVKQIKQQIEDKNYFKEIIVSTAGCTISAHCGPLTLGIFYITK